MFLSVTPLVIFKGTSGQFPATFSATKTVSFWQEVWASPTVLCLGVPDITVGGVFRKHVQCCSRTIIVTEQSLLLRCGSFATAVDVSGTSSYCSRTIQSTSWADCHCWKGWVQDRGWFPIWNKWWHCSQVQILLSNSVFVWLVNKNTLLGLGNWDTWLGLGNKYFGLSLGEKMYVRSGEQKYSVRFRKTWFG